MQIFNIFVLFLVLGCFYTICSACDLTNCSRKPVEICTTNGKQCRRFSNDCSLKSANCNAKPVWNTTETIQCSKLNVNATGSCSCPELRNCSNTAIVPGICVNLDGHSCRLFKTQCDLARDRCRGQPWRNIDVMQCRGFPVNETKPCICPKSVQCSRNETELCVQTNSTTCRLYNNECDLEGDRCQGQRLKDVSNVHCRKFVVGKDKTCTCPNVLGCKKNVTNICVKNSNKRCQLVKDQCDLEQQICNGAVLNRTLPVQCSNLQSGQTGDCACPTLDTCSDKRRNICVKTRVGCRLKTSECELERARCMGEVAIIIDPIQCRNFTPGEGRACSCPRLETCKRNNTNICVRSEKGCLLVADECQLERALCEGKNLTVVDGVQCKNFPVNQLRNCSCPKMGICTSKSPNTCVSISETQCKLVRNSCEVEKDKCLGQVLNTTDPLQCRGIPVNTTKNCFCPRLRNCSTTANNICVRDNSKNNTCLLLTSECEMEKAICQGKDITRVDKIYCRHFPANTSNTCFCPKLATCNRNASSVCVMSGAQCRLVKGPCELEQARCEGENLITTNSVQCLKFKINEQNKCRCPNLITCSKNKTRICVKTNRGCKVLTTQCELEEAKCRGEVIRVTDAVHCQGLSDAEEKACYCPQLKTCSRNNTKLCARNPQNVCTLLGHECDLEEAKCQGQDLSIVPELHCKNFTLKNPKNCECPNLFNCSKTATSICIKTSLGCKLLRNQCEVENEKCQRPVQIIPPQHCQGFPFGENRNCTCPNLKTCSNAKSNICIKTSTGCRQLNSECELEKLKCEGQNVKVLPAIQCKSLSPGTSGSCACPNWLNCTRTSNTSVCIETSKGCRSLHNQCDLEQRRCQGEVFNITNPLQCQGFTPGQLKNCACPELKTCASNNATKVCARNKKTCKVMTNSCELEMAKCRGENWCAADMEECKNLTIGQQAKCSCPKLQTCGKKNRKNICVNRGGVCKIMKDQCELEKAKCKGEDWSRTNPIQCQHNNHNQWQWCSCPRLLNCCKQKKPFCVTGPLGCKLMRTDCELQLARCKGEIWSRTDDLQCQGFKLGQNEQKCSCPKLTTCLKSTIPTGRKVLVCVRNKRGCQLLKNRCELERARCMGEVWEPVNMIQCLNFTMHDIRSCHCPGLESCSKTTRVCGKSLDNKCFSYQSECAMRWAQCAGKKLTLTIPQRCQGIRLNSGSECKCPESNYCNRQRQVCGRLDGQCKLYKNDCDFKKDACRNEAWRRVTLNSCCEFKENEMKNCTVVVRQKAICAQTTNNRCRVFSTKCDLDRVNTKKAWTVVDQKMCKCLRINRTGTCSRPLVCKTSGNKTPTICGKQGKTFKLFRSKCLLDLHNIENCTNFRAVNSRLCKRSG